MLIPILVVLPGIAAFVLKADISKPDEAYPWLLHRFVPSGIKGLVFAALIAAIVSSLAAITNSASTIFSIDIYKAFRNPNMTEKEIVNTGKISSIIIVFIASLIASTMSGINLVFQFIQEYTGLISPGITAMFILGMFWKKTTSRAAWVAVIITFPVPLILKWLLPSLPFLDNMLLSFFIIASVMIFVSLLGAKPEKSEEIWKLPENIFVINNPVFKYFSLGILVVLFLLYFIFW